MNKSHGDVGQLKTTVGGDEDLFKQEYPICPEEAFLSSGRCYFDKEIIIKRLKELEKIEPMKIGSFFCKYTGMKILDIQFQEEKKGDIQLYELPKKGRPYVLGGDTAGEGSDYSTAHVIDNITGKQVAKLKMDCDEIEYTKQIYCLGMFYNKALVGLENNFSTFPTQKLQELKYPNLYVREKEDTNVDKHEKAYGFKTTQITRPLILAILQEIFRDEIEKIVDRDTLEEALTFIKNKMGRPEAQQGYHDDLILALAITYYIRNQQTNKIEKIQKQVKEIAKKDWGETKKQRYGGDYGKTINVI